MSVLVGKGTAVNGTGFGYNRNGELVSGHKTGEGQWSLTNQVNGTQFDAEATRTGKHGGTGYAVTRTDPNTGEQTTGDFTVFASPNKDGSKNISVFDFDRDGFQPIPAPEPQPEPGPQPVTTPDGYSLTENENGSYNVSTPGGYGLFYDPANHNATITDPQTGESTNIWGDPHVTESDGGQWEWQSDTSSYILADGTKITMSSSGGDAANGFGTLESMDIYSGVGDTHMNLSADGAVVSKDSREADNAQADGDTYLGSRDASDWYGVSGQEMGA